MSQTQPQTKGETMTTTELFNESRMTEPVPASRVLAEQIADDLMTNGAGQIATRMQMMLGEGSEPERDIGGRNRESMIKTIQKHIRYVEYPDQ